MKREDFLDSYEDSTGDLAERAAEVARLLSAAARDFAPVVFASSLGAEDMVLTDLIWRQDIGIEIFTIDTGRLPTETHDLIARTERHYGRRIEICHPDAEQLALFVRTYGINGFYDSIEARKACCQARKVEPLRRKLAGKKAWVTGLRAEQSITRNSLRRIDYDFAFDLVKFNPLVDWSEREVWAYLHLHNVPYNALHDRHYPSIGCAPCTRAIQPGEDIRAGRWWWESPITKECGLHLVEGRLMRKACTDETLEIVTREAA
ncbi:phosphoadenylyl-sulfate reductase [Sulfuricystis multivorans]|uniref:phosphoadenylyl-sulfate reductase n=1 Tax=Sulfuricystis multivorans TaxID=2211108 RepID=UPI000F81D1E3|nr:phosphoadenylyl-sulfate reductase [Sulfuricystis multivorans]